MTIEAKSEIAAVTKPADVSGEPDMEAYAKARMSGVKPEVKATTAAVTNEDTSAATTDEKSSADATGQVNTDEKTTEASATAEEDQEVDVEETHPAKKSINKKFAKLTNKAKESEALALETQKALDTERARAAEMQAKLERLEAEAAQASKDAIPVVKPAAEDPAPKRSDFDDPDEFAIELSQHAAREAIRQSTKAAQEAAEERATEAKKTAETARQAKVQADITELHKTFQSRIDKAKESLPDFDEKVMKNDKVQIEPGVFFGIEKAELGPQILYHLASHPEKAEELNKLHIANPNDALIRLGELQAEIRIANKPVTSKAAAPVVPIKNRTNPERKTLDEMSMEEYDQQYKAKQAAEYARSHPQRVRK
jgi:hypothetical protein